jgi:hypothetical protein
VAQKPETAFRKRVTDFLRHLPNTVYFSVQQIAIIGTPDLICSINGRFVALELKSSADAVVSAVQQYNITRIVSVGGGIGLVISPEGWTKAQQYLSGLASNEDTTVPEDIYKC